MAAAQGFEMLKTELSLSALGWNNFFQQQLTLEECESACPVRVSEVHRDHLVVLGEHGERRLELSGFWVDADAIDLPTVGDWLIIETEAWKFLRCLQRKSVFKRQAAGSNPKLQLIAANIDTLFVVVSCNQDFNASRIERYLVLAKEAGAEPVLVLTKIDLCADAAEYFDQARAISSVLCIEQVDAREPKSVKNLLAWCGLGQTVGLVGSSGVGKSTLVNTLSGEKVQQTSGIREDDNKGHHTTRSRSMHLLSSGGLLIDTPGMRELKVVGDKTSLAAVFDDMEAYAKACRFKNCSHDNEPGCAVQAAISSGDLDARRLRNYQKLLAEQFHNEASLAEKHKRSKDFGKMTRRVQKDRAKNRYQDT